MVKSPVEIIKNYDGPQVRIMEVCGTHTHEIFRLGIRSLLSDKIQLISGPGCPVCVTAVDFIDEAVYLSQQGVTICTFGDLVRVPGTRSSLAKRRGEGGKVQVVYAPIDAVDYAEKHPDEEVVFLSVGFETTTPSCLLAVKSAMKRGLTNFSLLTANKTMPQAYQAMKDSTDVFLYPGHVHAITGTQLLEDLAADGTSGVVAGFTAKEIVSALAIAVYKFSQGEPFFVNAYPRVVTHEGSPSAIAMVEEMMEPVDVEWRGIGIIPQSGQQLKEAYAAYDARKKYQIPEMKGRVNPVCRCGDVLQGKCQPTDCKVFGTGCTPEHPIGACMVSGEGACSAYYLYKGSGIYE